MSYSQLASVTSILDRHNSVPWSQQVSSPSMVWYLIVLGHQLLLHTRPDRVHKMTLIPALTFIQLLMLFNHCRTPCRKVSTYSTGGAFAPIDPTLIWVAPKPKHRKRMSNVFLDDRGFPDQSNKYNHMLHDNEGGPILRKLRYPGPNLDDDVDPAFYAPFVPVKHEDQMRKNLDLSHLDFKNICLYLMRRVCLFQSRIMNASSTQELHDPSQSRKSCTVNARQSLCISASRP